MNCEQYRETIAADPSFDGGAGHLSECAACQAYRSEMQALDQTIRRALALDVPLLQMPELPEIDTTNVVSLSSRRVPTPAWLAMAATVVLAAFIGFQFPGTDIEHGSLADEILAHLDGEPAALRVTNVAISDGRLESVVPADVATMDHSAGLITYAQSCEIRGREVPHLVIQGERGPVTILLMPEEMVDGPQSLSGDNVNGVILPVGNGSIAILGDSEERLERIEAQVLKSVSWST